MIFYDADELCRKKMDKKGLRLKIYKVLKKVISGMSSSNGKDFHRCSIFGVSKQKSFVEIIAWSKLHCEQVVRVFATFEVKFLTFPQSASPSGARRQRICNWRLTRFSKLMKGRTLRSNGQTLMWSIKGCFKVYRRYVKNASMWKVSSKAKTIAPVLEKMVVRTCTVACLTCMERLWKSLCLAKQRARSSGRPNNSSRYLMLPSTTIKRNSQSEVMLSCVHDRSEGNMIPFPESFEDVQW